MVQVNEYAIPTLTEEKLTEIWGRIDDNKAAGMNDIHPTQLLTSTFDLCLKEESPVERETIDTATQNPISHPVP